MKRLHVSLNVSDLAATRDFYNTMFGAQPTMERENYVQWILDDPAVNFVIEDSCGDVGLTHLGIQASDAEELDQQFARVRATEAEVNEQGDTQCCFAKSTKNWVRDPDGIAWETFLTHERTQDFGTPFVPTNAHEAEVEARPKPTAARCC